MAKATNRNTSSKIELQKRIRIVQEWILQDYVTADIIKQSVDQWGVTQRQAYRYLWAANRFFEEQDKLSLKHKTAYYLARKKKLIRDMKPEEKKTAAGVQAINKVLDSMAKLDGVTVETIKLIGDPKQPLQAETKVTGYSSANIDYSTIPTEFLKYIISNRKAP